MEIEYSISSSEYIDNNDEIVVENNCSSEDSVNYYVLYESDEEDKPLLTVHDKKKWYFFFTGNDSNPIYDHTDLQILTLSIKHVACVNSFHLFRILPLRKSFQNLKCYLILSN